MNFFLVAEHLVTNKQYDLISSPWYAVPLIVDYQIQYARLCQSNLFVSYVYEFVIILQ